MEGGFANEFVTVDSKARAVQHILLHEVFKVRRDEIDAIRMGMDSVNLIDFLFISERCIPLVFPLSNDMTYTPEDVIKCIRVDEEILSVRQVEVIEFFNKYIKELVSVVDNSLLLNNFKLVSSVFFFE